MHADLDRQRQVTWAQIIAAAENDFEPPVFARHGSLRGIKEALVTSGAEVALLSGSGATVFGLFRDETQARRAEAQFLPQKNHKVFVVPTCSGPLAVR
jgi:4-diphosphocytidyl-2-C-methyl-D-erythritol kinase